MAKRTKDIVVFPDTHFGLGGNGGHDEVAFKTALKCLPIVEPKEIIHIGDLGEWESVSHWKWAKKAKPPIQYILDELDRDYDETNRQLDRIDEACEDSGVEQKTILGGNHEEWIDMMIGEVGAIAKAYDFKRRMRLAERGWTHHPYGEYIRRGALSMYHGGHYSTKHHAYNHLANLGVSVAYGHTHDVQVATKATLNGSIGAWSLGCLCKLKKPFLKGRPNNWAHAIGKLHVRANGDFLMTPVRIENGWCKIDGEEIFTRTR